MSGSRFRLVVLALFALVFVGGPSSTKESEAPRSQALTTASAAGRVARMPLRFEENTGQMDARVRYVARRGRASVFLTDEGATFAFTERPRAEDERTSVTAVAMKVAGGRAVAPRASALLPTKTNYFIGKDRAKWRTGVSSYGRVTYPGVRDGVDLVFHGERGQIEYDFVVAPGADPGAIAMDVEGARGLTLTSAGDLAILTARGEIVQKRPRVYQRGADGATRDVAAGYRITGDARIAFEVASYDRTRELVIDPIVGYSTYFGGSDFDDVLAVAADAQGHAFLTGYTGSGDLPKATGTPASCEEGCNVQAFVARVNPTGTAFDWVTYVGGNGDDDGLAIAVDGASRAYVTGQTSSDDLGVTANALKSTPPECFSEGFIARLTATGAVDYLSYLENTVGQAIAVDAVNDLYVGGAGGFGCASAVEAIGPYSGGLVTKLTIGAAATAVAWSRTDLPYVAGLAIDASGHAYATGSTGQLRELGALDIGATGGSDVVVSKMHDGASPFDYQTVIGGSDTDFAAGIAVDGSGNAFVTGTTYSDDAAETGFPTTAGAFQTTSGEMPDAFVFKLDPTGQSLVYSTRLGGDSSDQGLGIVVDGAGNAYVVGETQSTDFPVVPAGSSALSGIQDLFVTKLAPTGAALILSGYFGGSGYELIENPAGIAIDQGGGVYIAGTTESDDLLVVPNPGAAQTAGHFPDNEGKEGFVAKVSLPVLVINPPSANVAPGGAQTFAASGGAGFGYAYSFQTNASGGTINASTGQYTAGPAGNTTDVVKVTDGVGGTATATVNVSASLAINPPTGNVPPRGTLSFSASGGNPPFSFSLAANASGATITPSGAYKAGPSGGGTDIVRVTDASGATRSANVTVGAGVTITPASPETPPLGQIAFTAAGGSGAGYTWSLASNAGGGGAIDPATGVYTAGPGSTVDTVKVSDSLGNTAAVNVSVGGAIAASPAAPTTPPRGTVAFSAVGGSHFYTWSISTNASGGTIDPNTGAYTAGATGSVTDTVKVVDTNGASTTIDVLVGPAMTISPVTTSVYVKQFVVYQVSGGAGGYVYSFDDTASGATIQQDGIYQAGDQAGDDHVRVTDSLGNTALAVVGVSLLPPPPPPATVDTPTFTLPTGGGSDDCSCRVVGGGTSRAPAGTAAIAGLALGLALLARRRRAG
jgi:hypothetical protein